LARIGTLGGLASGRKKLSLKVTPHFSAAWLIPQLSSFLERYRDIELAIESSNRNVDFDLEPFDAGICVGDGRFPGRIAHHLLDISTTPIATPTLARRLRLRQPQDLRRATLIRVATYPAAWAVWLQHVGEPRLEPAQTISVDTFVL
jgi:DNA-binding transcriptional LysR family regulator